LTSFKKGSHSLALGLALALLLCTGARAAPALPLSHSGRWLTDARGRVVIVHGINMVYKLPPYDPGVTGFGNDDAAFLARIGFDAVRVGVIWKAVEPTPGHYNDAYLRQIAGTVATLARHGVLSLLDFHQDMYNELFQGEGAPDWAVQTGGLPNPKLGFPGNYTGNPALQHALDAFFDDASGPRGVGLQVYFARAWAHVATRFRHDPSVLGYEQFNEPFPGTAWTTCSMPATCTFDAKLTAFYRRVNAAIRGVDPRTLDFYEPNVLFNDGVDTTVGALEDPHAGFAFHDYCLTPSNRPACDKADDMVFANALAHVAKTHEALLETEFGSTDNVSFLQDQLARADRNMVPWLEWSYCSCSSPTDTGTTGIVKDPSKPPRGSNLIEGTLHALVEPYPQVISGTPLSWSYDVQTRTFQLAYSTRRVGRHGAFAAGSITEISTPALVYRGRYRVRVKGGVVTSRPGAALLRIRSGAHAMQITVTVSPR
jgi:endoglycosylceramidase